MDYCMYYLVVDVGDEVRLTSGSHTHFLRRRRKEMCVKATVSQSVGSVRRQILC